MEMLAKFSDEDVKDLLGACPFKDRFKIRQYLRVQGSHVKPVASDHPTSSHLQQKDHASCSSSISTSANNSFISMGDESIDLTSTDLDAENTNPNKAPTDYSAEEMLQKKKWRGKPNAAQSFFHGLIRDAAAAAHIWKKALPLHEISQKKMDIFLETVLKHAPHLRLREREVKQRLGEHLQNRRKYLRDVECGKRKSTSKTDKGSTRPKIDGYLTKGTVSPQIEGKNENSTELDNLDNDFLPIPGDPVSIYDKKKKLIGQGVYITRNGIYGEVVVRSVLQQEGDPAELPAPVDNLLVFDEKVVKRTILWRIERLKKSSNSKSNSKPVKPTSKNSTKAKSKECTSSPAKKPQTHPKSTSYKGRDTLALKQNSIQSGHGQICMYEWTRGQIYFGVVGYTHESKSIIQNCLKPVGAIVNKSIKLAQPFNVNGPICQLNPLDMEPNPNPAFKIMSCTSMTYDYSEGKLRCPDVDDFKKDLQLAFEKYIN